MADLGKTIDVVEFEPFPEISTDEPVIAEPIEVPEAQPEEVPV